MFPQVPYSPTPYMMPPSLPPIYPDFTNAYGFIGNGNPPRPFPNSNNGSRSFSGSKPNGGYRGSNFGNGRGQFSGPKQSGGTWQS